MAANTKTLVCFGDSLTEGTIGASYIDILHPQLPGVRVVNAGINGDTVLNLLRRFERDVLPQRPDVVVVFVGLNDVGTAYGEIPLRGYYHLVTERCARIRFRAGAALHKAGISDHPEEASL